MRIRSYSAAPIAVLLLLGPFAGGVPGAEPAAGPWPAPVPGWEPVKPGEHPRLFFRKSDLPALRTRAETPEGKSILARLRKLLNGGDGETMPAGKRPVDAAFGDKSQELSLPEGTYSSRASSQRRILKSSKTGRIVRVDSR